MKPEDFSPVFENRFEHISYAFNLCTLNGYILEFGVFKGYTIKYIASLTDNHIFGFDSFEGLPEPWDQGGGRKIEYKDRFKIDKLPEIPENVELVVGWFEDTLDNWIINNNEIISFLHIDSDIYSSCKTILTKLNNRIVPNTIIVFDEMFGYKNYKQHEYKACVEWLKENNREIEFLARTNKYGASIRVVK